MSQDSTCPECDRFTLTPEEQACYEMRGAVFAQKVESEEGETITTSEIIECLCEAFDIQTDTVGKAAIWDLCDMCLNKGRQGGIYRAS